MARLLFLGRLEDIVGAPELHIPLAQPETLAAVLARLPQPLAQAVVEPRIRLAVNGVLCATRDPLIAVTDEVAFLPPVSGG